MRPYIARDRAEDQEQQRQQQQWDRGYQEGRSGQYRQASHGWRTSNENIYNPMTPRPKVFQNQTYQRSRDSYYKSFDNLNDKSGRFKKARQLGYEHLSREYHDKESLKTPRWAQDLIKICSSTNELLLELQTELTEHPESVDGGELPTSQGADTKVTGQSQANGGDSLA